MAGVVADSIVILLEAKQAKYIKDMEAAAKKTEDVFKRIRDANKPISLTTSNKSTNVTAEKEALRTEGVKRREAEKTAGQIERLEARKAAAAEKAAERKAAADEKAAQRVIAASQKAADKEIADQARISAAIEAGVNKSAVAIAQGSGLGGRSGNRDTVANQTRLMSGTSLSGISPTPAEDKVNYLLRDQIDLRTKLGAAIAAGEAKAITSINDQLTLLRLIDQYKRAGLNETEAAVRAEQGLASIVKVRAKAEANAALEQQANAAKGVAGVGRVANGYRNLGRQISDVGVGVAGGLNPFLIIAQQAPQVADALTDTGGKAAKVAAFFAGPWGAALLAAGSILGVFASRLFDTEASLDDLVEKLSKDADETAKAEKAKSLFGRTIEGVTLAIQEDKKALDDHAQSERSFAENAELAARAKLKELAAIQATTRAKLADALTSQQALAAPGNSTDASLNSERNVVNDRITRYKQELAKLDADQATANANLQKSFAEQIVDFSKLDTAGKANKFYDLQIRKAKEAANATDIASGAFRRQVDALNVRRQAYLKTLDAEKKAANAKPGPSAIGRTVDVAGATAIVNSIGGRVTSGLRSTADQTRIYNDKLAGRHIGPVAVPGTSAHERGQAVDVAFGAGISVASLKKAFNDAGVAIRQILPEPTQRVFHVEFGKAGKSAQSFANEAQRTAEKQVRNNDAFEEQKLRLDDILLSARGREARSIEEQAEQAVADAKLDNDRRKRGFQSDFNQGRLTEAGLKELQLKSDGIATTQIIDASLEKRAALARQTAGLGIQSKDAAISTKEAELAVTVGRKARAQLEDEILEAKYEQRRLVLEGNILEAQKNKDAVAEQKARDDLALLPAQRKAEVFQNAENRKNPIQEYRDSFKDPERQVQQAVADKLRQIDEGITNAVADKLGIKDPLLKSLLQTFIQQNILKPLYDGVSQSGNGSGNFFSGVISAASSIFGGARASGGDVTSGKPYLIGERGPELFVPGGSGKIVPTGRVNANRGGGTTVIAPQQFDLRGVVMAESLIRQLQVSNRNYANQVASRAGKTAYDSSPSRSQRLSTLGT